MNYTIAEIVGANVVHYRKKNNWSLRQLAEQTGDGLQHHTLYRLENALITEVKFEYFDRLAAVFGVSYLDLFSYTENTLQVLEEKEQKKVVRETPGRMKIYSSSGSIKQLPRNLFHASRIEMRNMNQEDGLPGRVDLFETVEEALNFVGGPPCDIYQVSGRSLSKKKLKVLEHPMWRLYSYYDDISPKQIKSMATHR